MKALLFLIAMNLVLPVQGQINVSLIHQLVEDSKREYVRQQEARTGQARNAANEDINKNLMASAREKYQAIHNRFAQLGWLLDGVGLITEARPLVNAITENQEMIFRYCQTDVRLIPLALSAEEVFVQKSLTLMNYLIGLSAVIGDLNQMKASERRMLFRHALDELRLLNGYSQATLQSLKSLANRIRNPAVLRHANEMLIDEVITNYKILGR